jgi:hypothetical protein
MGCSAVLISWRKEFNHPSPRTYAEEISEQREKYELRPSETHLFRDERRMLDGHVIVLAQIKTNPRFKQRHWLFIEAFLDAIRQTQRKCNDRQRRIERSAGREYRAAGHV